MIKKLASYIGEYKKATILTPLYMIGEVLMEVLIPLVMAAIIDNGLNGNNGQGDLGYVVKVGSLMFLMALISLFFGTMSGFKDAEASAGFAKNLRQAIYNKIQTFSFSNIDKFSSSSLVTRLTTDITTIQNAFQMIIRMAVRSPLMLIFSFIMAFRISRSLSLVFLVAIPILAIAIGLIMVKTFPKFQIMFKKYDVLNRVIQENVSAIRVVKAYTREDHEVEKFHDAANDIYKTSVAAEKMIALTSPIMQFSMYGCILAIAWFASSQIVYGSLTTGEFMSLLTYIMSILGALMMLSIFFLMIVMSQASCKRVCEVLDEVPDLDNPENPIKEIEDGSIEFNNVSFSYYKDPNKLHLQNINLKIPSGKTVGILGGTGSGKTTLVSLIPRLYDVTSGEVKVGGVDVRKYDIETLRSKVAMVLQNNVLFSGSISENIRWGNENASQEEIEEMCKLACADEFVKEREHGYDTELGQGGVNVSGGQKQRLCIARALIKKPKILILDDSTSAVDMNTDARIRKAFKEEIPNTTKLIIAQRVSSVQDADIIIVMDKGSINAIGTHDELLQTCSIYKETFETQTKAKEVE